MIWRTEQQDAQPGSEYATLICVMSVLEPYMNAFADDKVVYFMTNHATKRWPDNSICFGSVVGYSVGPEPML
jgi:hypothetical protein